MKRRRDRGGSIVETAAGCILLVPVALLMVDGGAAVIAQIANDTLAKHCARAAADQNTYVNGQGSANQIYSEFKDNGVVVKVSLTTTDVTGNWDQARCDTVVKCMLPVPVPFTSMATVNFQTFAVEPVVGKLDP